MTRPLLLVDVDGVLLVLGSYEGDEEHGYEPVFVSEAGAWLRELAQRFDLVWATSWESLANVEVAPRLGLGPLPVIHFDPDYDARTPKLRSAAAYVGERPCAWIDDDLGRDADAWAAGRAAATLLLHVDRREGLQRRHVDELLSFAASLD